MSLWGPLLQWVQDESTASSAPSPPAKGMRGIMQRALQQARTEAAAEAQGTHESAPQDPVAAPAISPEAAPQPPGGDKKTFGAVLRQAAQKMQQEEAKSGNRADPESPQLQAPAGASETLQGLNGDLDQEHAGDDLLDAADINVQQADALSSESITAELLPARDQHMSPSRGASLGPRLGSVLRNALSIPRQFSYAPLEVDDDIAYGDEGPFGAGRQPAPGLHRALPRDASYLPEWLDLRRKATRDRSSSSARSSADFSRSSQVSRAGSALPEWVDAAALQQPAPDSTHFPEPGPCQSALQELIQPPRATNESGRFERLLKPAARPIFAPDPPKPLITAPSWPPTQAEEASGARESRGKRLLAFWQQQQATAAAPLRKTQLSLGLSQPEADQAAEQHPAMIHPQAHAVHSQSRTLQTNRPVQAQVLSDGMIHHACSLAHLAGCSALHYTALYCIVLLRTLLHCTA